MGQLSIWHWIILVVVILPVIPIARILRRTGFNPWWAILFVIPVVGYLALWVFAYIRWPGDEI